MATDHVTDEELAEIERAVNDVLEAEKAAGMSAKDCEVSCIVIQHARPEYALSRFGTYSWLWRGRWVMREVVDQAGAMMDVIHRSAMVQELQRLFEDDEREQQRIRARAAGDKVKTEL